MFHQAATISSKEIGLESAITSWNESDGDFTTIFLQHVLSNHEYQQLQNHPVLNSSHFISDVEGLCADIIANDHGARMAIVRMMFYLQDCNRRNVAAAAILTNEDYKRNEEHSNYIAIELLTMMKYSPATDPNYGRKYDSDPEPVLRVSYATSDNYKSARIFLRDVPLKNILHIQISEQALYDIHDGAMYRFVDGCGLWDAPSSLEVHEGVICVSDLILCDEDETDADVDTNADNFDYAQDFDSQSRCQSRSLFRSKDRLPQINTSLNYEYSSDESYCSKYDEEHSESDDLFAPNELFSQPSSPQTSHNHDHSSFRNLCKGSESSKTSKLQGSIDYSRGESTWYIWKLVRSFLFIIIATGGILHHLPKSGINLKAPFKDNNDPISYALQFLFERMIGVIESLKDFGYPLVSVFSNSAVDIMIRMQDITVAITADLQELINANNEGEGFLHQFKDELDSFLNKYSSSMFGAE